MSSIAVQFPPKTPAQAIREICAKLTDTPRRKEPAYTLIVGAGFSYGVAPLTKEMLHECIGDVYFLDQDQPSMPRTRKQKRQLSAQYWQDFKAAGSLCNQPLIKLDVHGLPENPTEAYQLLFTYRVANALFSEHRSDLGGEKFVKENVLYSLTDRPERGLDRSDFPEDEPFIHLVYTHG